MIFPNSNSFWEVSKYQFLEFRKSISSSGDKRAPNGRDSPLCPFVLLFAVLPAPTFLISVPSCQGLCLSSQEMTPQIWSLPSKSGHWGEWKVVGQSVTVFS